MRRETGDMRQEGRDSSLQSQASSLKSSRTLKSNILLLLAAMLWGFAFVAQRAGMEHVGPFIFNGVRFALGGISLLPLILVNRKRRSGNDLPSANRRIFALGGGLAGLALFIAASLQQIGIIYTTAGKAGFITGLYVIIVPILGLLGRQRTDIGTWIGAVIAATGLYFLSVTENFTISPGDLLVLISAFFWAVHVHIIGWLSARTDPIKLAFFQFLACSALSLAAAVSIETISIQALSRAIIPILYGGLVSVGIAFTLQVVGQRHAHPAHAAIILSLETVFAVIGGWLILSENLSPRSGLGCALMLAGMFLSQLRIKTGFHRVGLW
jgi:drug/metabolite transporter (DMT)-like permease